MRMMTTGFVAMTATLMLGGCASTFEAEHDHDASHNFSNYRTFAWISRNPMQVGVTAVSPSPLLEQRVMNAVEGGLRAKGYRKVEVPGTADFVLSFTVGSRENIKIDSYPTMGAAYGHPARWGWGGGYYGHGTETRVRQYTTGMLAIDIFDVNERRPVWHGVASKTISEADRKQAEVTVQAAVDAILEGFPPQ